MINPIYDVPIDLKHRGITYRVVRLYTGLPQLSSTSDCAQCFFTNMQLERLCPGATKCERGIFITEDEFLAIKVMFGGATLESVEYLKNVRKKKTDAV